MKRAGQRMLFLLLLPLLLLSFAGHEAAAAGSSAGKIVMDSKELAMPKGVILENVNGSIMIPIRVVVENLGFQVLWEQSSRKVTVQQGGKSIQLAVGSKTAEADGVNLELNAAPKQKGSTVLVPIRFVSQQFGLSVGWDNMDKTVYLSGGSPGSSPSEAPGPLTSDPLPSATAAPGANVPVPAPTPQPQAGNESSEEVEGSITASPTPAVTSPQVKGAVFSENRLMIAVAGGAKPTVTKVSGPDRIVVDFQGASFASDFNGSFPGVSASGSPQGKLDVSGYPLITEIRYALFSNSPPTVRFVIQTAGSQNYQLSTDDSTGLVTVDLNTAVDIGADTPVNPGLTGKPVIVLDAGHGGTQPGAISLTGKTEKAFNLAVILKVGALLSQEGLADVVYTRTDDTTLNLKGRVVVAEAAKATLFISLHANSLDKDYPNREKVNGSETYYSRSESLPLAQIMHKHLIAGTGFKDNGVRSKSLHVTRETSMPAVLLEAGYLCNPGNEAALFTEQVQDNLAREIVAGIKEYLGL